MTVRTTATCCRLHVPLTRPYSRLAARSYGFLKLQNDASLSQLGTAGTNLCATDWATLQTTYPKVKGGGTCVAHGAALMVRCTS